MDSLLCYHIVLLFVATVSVCLLWVGFATPGWLVVTFQEAFARSEYTVSSLNRSLFYDVHCPQELVTCKTCMLDEDPGCRDRLISDNNLVRYKDHHDWVERLMGDKDDFELWRGIMLTAVILAFFGLILVMVLVCCRLNTTVYRIIAGVAFFLWLVVGIIVWIPVGMVADLHETIRPTIDENIPHDATLHVPYSVIIAALGAFFALITALMLLWLFCKRLDTEYGSDSRSFSDLYIDRRPKSRMYIEEPAPVYYPRYVEESVYNREYKPTYVEYPATQVVTEMVPSPAPMMYYGPYPRSYYDY